MIDMADTIIPKSDQLNADDLIAGPITITIASVSKVSGDQPIAVSFAGDGGKPYKPCKSMRKVMVHVWGRDGMAYVGRSMSIFRDPKVRYGGLEVGGIRISHMSHIVAPVTMALTETNKKRVAYRVEPLQIDIPVDDDVTLDAPTLDEAKTMGQMLEALRAALTPEAAPTREAVDAVVTHDRVGKALAREGSHVGIMRGIIAAAIARTAGEVSGEDHNPA